MGLCIQDIQTLRRDSIILYYCPTMGWAKAKIIDMGLNYFHMQALEGCKVGHPWKEDIQRMMETNKYHLYIPPAPKKPTWFQRWLRKKLVNIIKRIPQ